MKKHNHEQMLSLYNQWQSSGESKKDFAVSHSIRPATFYYWTRKFEQPQRPDKQGESTSGFHHLSIEAPSHKDQGELMAAIQYPSGTRLELYSSFQHLSSSYVELLKTLTH